MRRAVGFFSWAVIVCAVLAAALMFVPSFMGYERYVLTGKSMTGTINKGSLVFDEVVPTRSLKVGDIITYQPPGHKAPFTHRIIKIQPDPKGRIFTTKGDANSVKDPLPVQFNQRTQARFKFAVPHLGWPFIWLANPTHRFVALGLPIVLIALFNLASVLRDVRNTRRVSPNA